MEFSVVVILHLFGEILVNTAVLFIQLVVKLTRGAQGFDCLAELSSRVVRSAFVIVFEVYLDFVDYRIEQLFGFGSE